MATAENSWTELNENDVRARSTSCRSSCSGPLPFALLDGEQLIIEASPVLWNQSVYYALYVTTFRVVAVAEQVATAAAPCVEFPISTVRSVEVVGEHSDNERSVLFLLVSHCGPQYRFTVFGEQTSEQVALSLRRAMAPLSAVESAFAFRHAVADEARKKALWRDVFDLAAEYARVGLDASNGFRVSDCNRNFDACPTYPQELALPASVRDEALLGAAAFRAQRRLPVAVWRSSVTGGLLLRSAQPLSGITLSRSPLDEELVSLFVQQTPSRCLFIFDCRGRTAALGNLAKGGGYENRSGYGNVEFQFLNLANIHGVRDSFDRMTAAWHAIERGTKKESTWLVALQDSKWLHNLSALLRSAKAVARQLRKGFCVLVHCSDGWDRTPQVCALAQLMLDPYFRTPLGLQHLIEKEFVAFGHPFAGRTSIGSKGRGGDELSPIFLQFLDCVHQIRRQFPTEFSFTEGFLLQIMQHVYSARFGTFLCNSEMEREMYMVRARTFPVWALLADPSVRRVPGGPLQLHSAFEGSWLRRHAAASAPDSQAAAAAAAAVDDNDDDDDEADEVKEADEIEKEEGDDGTSGHGSPRAAACKAGSRSRTTYGNAAHPFSCADIASIQKGGLDARLDASIPALDVWLMQVPRTLEAYAAMENKLRQQQLQIAEMHAEKERLLRQLELVTRHVPSEILVAPLVGTDDERATVDTFAPPSLIEDYITPR